MIHMIKARKRTPHEKLDILKRLAKNHDYGFELVGKKTADMTLKELGGHNLEKYYKEQAQKYNQHFDTKKPCLQNYCCLYTYMLKKNSKGDTTYLGEEDTKYAMETVITLDAIVDQKLDIVEQIKESRSLADTEKQYALEKICSEVAGYVRAISTLSSTDFEPSSKEKKNKKLKEDAERTIAFYEEAGAIKK